MIRKMDNGDIVMDRDSAIALYHELTTNHSDAIDLSDLEDVLADDEQIEGTLAISFEAQIRAIGEDEAEVKLRELLDDTRVMDAIAEAAYKALQDAANDRGLAIDFSAVNMDGHSLDI